MTILVDSLRLGRTGFVLLFFRQRWRSCLYASTQARLFAWSCTIIHRWRSASDLHLIVIVAVIVFIEFRKEREEAKAKGNAERRKRRLRCMALSGFPGFADSEGGGKRRCQVLYGLCNGMFGREIGIFGRSDRHVWPSYRHVWPQG